MERHGFLDAAGRRKAHVLSVATREGASSTFLFILAVWGGEKATGSGFQLHQSLVLSRGPAHSRPSINAYGMDADVSLLSVEA